MSRDLKLLQEVVESGNRIMLEQLKSSGNYTDDDIHKAISAYALKACKLLSTQGRVVSVDELEKYVTDREEFPYDGK